MSSSGDSLPALLELLRAYCAAVAPGEVPLDFRVKFASGRKLEHPVPVALPARDQRSPAARTGTRHSADFRSVVWVGTEYTFTPTQAACVRVLWEAWQNDDGDLGQDTVLDRAGSESGRLAPLFHGHPAWGTMIVKGETKGSYRLAEA